MVLAGFAGFVAKVTRFMLGNQILARNQDGWSCHFKKILKKNSEQSRNLVAKSYEWLITKHLPNSKDFVLKPVYWSNRYIFK